MKIVIGLGANLGDRIGTMREAVRRIGGHAAVEAVSRVYETDPIGGPEQPAYLNAAIAITWDREPIALLDLLQGIERDLGRVRDVRWGPRTIDLDVLWSSAETRIDHPRLVVPHPRLHERAFALRPLLDVAPDAASGVGVRSADDPGVRPTNLSLVPPLASPR